MHDVAGFAILVGVLVLALWVMVAGVLPLVSTWMAGMVGFFLVAVVLLRGGRRCPDRLPGLLRPGVAPLMVGAALVLPALHGMLLFLGDETPHWAWVAVCNVLPPIAFTSRALSRHLVDSRRFRREGHDVAELVDDVRSRLAALGVLADRLAMAAAPGPAPEPWEAVAGDAVGATEIPPGDVEALARRVEVLRPPLAEILASLEAVLAEVRAGNARTLPHPGLAPIVDRGVALEAEAVVLAAAVDECLGESRGRPLSSWAP